MDATNRILALQVQATREGGAVARGHACPHLRPYSVASHSYGAVSLLLLLHPGPSLNLIKALQWHDVAERWLGDMPATAKWDNVALAEVYERTEWDHLERLGLLPKITPGEQRWLKCLDTLELWLWCREELSLGNTNVIEWINNCETALTKYRNTGVCPDEVWSFFRRVGENEPERLPDVFSHMLVKMHGAAHPPVKGEPEPAPAEPAPKMIWDDKTLSWVERGSQAVEG